MNLLNYTKRYFESKILIFLFLAIYLLSGIFIFKDYGISFDENINRFNGFVSLKYIFQKLGVNINLNLFVNNFNSRIKENIRSVKKLPKLKNIKEIMYPGQNKFNRYKKNFNKEIKITDDIKKDIEKLLN